MSTLSIATDGMIGDRSPLSMATDGLVRIVDADSLVVMVATPPTDDEATIGGGGGGGGWYPATKYKIAARDIRKDIHRDDEEVLEILIQAVTSGVLH